MSSWFTSQNQCCVRGHDAALAADHAGVGIGYLPRPAFAADLSHAFDDKLHARHAGLAEQPARRVQRQLAAEANTPARDEVAALALLAEAVILERDDRHDAEAVVELG